jgi:signal transduction histidine kinase
MATDEQAHAKFAEGENDSEVREIPREGTATPTDFRSEARSDSPAGSGSDSRSDSGSDSRAPVVHSSMPVSREVRISGRSGPGQGLAQTPGTWLDRLLVATIELPVSDGEEAVVLAMLRALSDIMPACGIGACLVSAPPGAGINGERRSTRDLASVGAEQKVYKVTPPGEDHRAVGMDPTRLFPGYAFEFSLGAEPNGSTLHIAGDDASIMDDHSAVRHVLERAAQGMGRGLVFARSHGKANEDAGNLRVLMGHMVQAEKLASLGQIAAGVVHELNNPLTSIVAYTDLLLRKMTADSQDPADLERLRRIGESATRMLRFTRDLVTYSRPSQQRTEPVRVSTVIDRALAFCEHVIAEAGVTVSRDFGTVPEVSGMPEQLAQVFVNLITNACHAMPESSGALLVTTSVEEDRVRVTVEDNGHGIPTENLTNIFTPFFTTKSEGRGTGLGLSIVRNIVEQHQGEIWAEPTSTGTGTRFVILLRPV